MSALSEEKSIFKLEIGDGGKAVKGLLETIEACLHKGKAVFTVDQNGLYSCTESVDRRILCLVNLNAKQFRSFRYYGVDGTGAGSFSFAIDMENFFASVKKVRVKETIFMILYFQSPHEIFLKTVRTENSPQSESGAGTVSTSIAVQPVQPPQICIAADYDEKKTVAVSNKIFLASSQSLNTKPSGSTLKVRRFKDGTIVFSSKDKAGVEKESQFHSPYPDGKGLEVDYEQNYSTNLVFSIKKMINTTNNILISLKENNPMRMVLNVQQLGTFTVYIKSQELLDAEKNIANEDLETN